MRVALFTDTFFPQTNGVATGVAALARELGRRGHDVIVVCPRDPRVGREFLAPRVEVIRLPSIPALLYPDYRLSIGRFFSAAARLRSFQPDVVHLHTAFTVGLFARSFARTEDIPLVGTSQVYLTRTNQDFLQSVMLLRPLQRLLGGLVRHYLRWFYRPCDLRLALTQTLCLALLEEGWKQPCEVLPNGIALQLFTVPAPPALDALRRRYRLREHVLIHLGRLSMEKNVEDVLRTFAIVLSRHPTASLLLIGDGPDRRRLQRISDALGIRDDVVFVGAVLHHDLQSSGILALGDVFVTGSLVEAQGVVLVEAMSFGLPVVCMAGGAAPEVVGDGGIVVAPHDVNAMAEAVLHVLNDSADSDLRVRARARASAFSIETVTERQMHLYERAIALHPRKG